jgi:GDPmannose 4,6-dehydratase
MMKKVAFITGITGQDGSYLAEFLIAKGYEVHGLIRLSSSVNTNRLSNISQPTTKANLKLNLHYGDLMDSTSLSNLIYHIRPHEVYNLAAQSHVKVSFATPQYTSQVTGIGAGLLLDLIKISGIDCRYYQASTSELFGSTPPPQNENSVFRPRSPYATAKLMAYWSTVNHREAYGIHATNGILFNHESPRRGETFVTRKISRAVAKIATGSKEKLYLGNLDAVRDWGYAKEYVESMWLMLQQDKPDDYVVATGVGATVRDFAQAAFEHAGLNYKDHIEIDKRYQRPTEVDALIGDPSKAEKILGWKAKTHWRELAKLMVDADLEKAKSKSN